LYAGTPDDAVGLLTGTVFTKTIRKSDISEYRNDYKVISTQLKSGELSIRILSDTDPPNGFSPVIPNLEDVYFMHINSRVKINSV
jgi:ABC-2 type transport system ATP-binding protein